MLVPKLLLRNQVLITVRTNSVVATKRNAISDTLKYIFNEFLFFQGFGGSVLTINVIETFFRKLWCLSSEKSSKRYCCMHVIFSS